METAIVPSQDVRKRILTFRKPNGVYAAITPWNFPTLIPVELIAPGIAAGNTIVIKPSEWTPIAMANFMQIMADAGLPEGVVNVVFGSGREGERLVTHQRLINGAPLHHLVQHTRRRLADGAADALVRHGFHGAIRADSYPDGDLVAAGRVDVVRLRAERLPQAAATRVLVVVRRGAEGG